MDKRSKSAQSSDNEVSGERWKKVEGVEEGGRRWKKVGGGGRRW